MANAPTITWYLCDSSGSSTSMSNVVNYDAVQAGSYSNVVCVKPTMDATNAASIGKVRFWWNDINGAVSGGTENSLPSLGWVMKYYVSYCNSDSARSTSTVTQADMSTLFAKPQVKLALTQNQILTNDVVNGSSLSSFSLSTYYCRSTWQNATDKDNYVCMQPVPFFTNTTTGFTSAGKSDDTGGGEIDNFKDSNHYGTGWIEKTFGSGNPNKVDGKSLLYYSVGGALNEDGKGCNLTSQVTTVDGFPYIFLTIRPPTTADAGVWSGFSCRLSFVWPWTSTNTGSVSTVS